LIIFLTQIAVSADKLDTEVDIPEVVNLVFFQERTFDIKVLANNWVQVNTHSPFWQF